MHTLFVSQKVGNLFGPKFWLFPCPSIPDQVLEPDVLLAVCQPHSSNVLANNMYQQEKQKNSPSGNHFMKKPWNFLFAVLNSSNLLLLTKLYRIYNNTRKLKLVYSNTGNRSKWPSYGTIKQDRLIYYAMLKLEFSTVPILWKLKSRQK